jgi:hypothetical protein
MWFKERREPPQRASGDLFDTPGIGPNLAFGASRAVVPSIRLTAGDLLDQYRCLERAIFFDPLR